MLKDKLKIDKDPSTWDAVGWKPEEVFTIEELYAKVGKFPFRVRKAKRVGLKDPKNNQRNWLGECEVGTVYPIIGVEDGEWKWDETSFVVDSKSWRLA
jgi:hypothetical protein